MKHSRLFLVVALGFMLSMLSALGCGPKPTTEPEKAFYNFHESLEEGEYDLALSYLHEDLRPKFVTSYARSEIASYKQTGYRKMFDMFIAKHGVEYDKDKKEFRNVKQRKEAHDVSCQC